MPEQDKKEGFLPGETSVSQSSDQYITGTINQMQREMDGVNNTVLDGDSYTTKLIGTETAIDNNEVDIPLKPLSIVNELNGTDSAFGIRVLRTRKKELKKAA